jgi:hypothetical protein
MANDFERKMLCPPIQTVYCLPVTDPSHGGIDHSSMRFIFSGPRTLKNVELFANDLHQHFGVLEIEIEESDRFNPPLIEMRFKLIDSSEWQSGDYENPEDNSLEPVSLFDFVAGSLRQIANKP